MELSSSDKERIQHQYDALAKKTLVGEAKSHRRTLAKRAAREVTFSDLSESELAQLFTTDEYETLLPPFIRDYPTRTSCKVRAILFQTRSVFLKPMRSRTAFPICNGTQMTVILGRTLLGLDSDTFYIYHVAAVMVDNLRRLLLGINLSDKAIMDFDFPGVGFPV